MRASHRQQLAGITMMATGAVIGGGDVTATVDDHLVYSLARDVIISIVGGDQDGITQQDGKDTLLWVLDPTRDRGPASIQLVWNHGRKASKPLHEGAPEDGADLAPIVDLSARRSQRVGQQIAQQYTTVQIIAAIRARGGFCPKCKLKIQAHTDEKLIACYGGDHRCGACHEPWSAHTPGEVRAHVELIAQLATQPHPPHGA
jgi:hypothetical protein